MVSQLTVVIRQGGDLDRELVFHELAPLVEFKGSYDGMERLRALIDASPT